MLVVRKKDEQFVQMIELACRYDKPVRLVNGGVESIRACWPGYGRK